MTYSDDELASDLNFGRVIRGLTGKDIEEEGVRNELKRLWIQHGLLFRLV